MFSFVIFRSLSFGLLQDCAKQMSAFTDVQIKQRHAVCRLTHTSHITHHTHSHITYHTSHITIYIYIYTTLCRWRLQ